MIREDLSKKNVIDFASLKKVPTTVYIILPPKYLVTHGTWLRLMVTAALQPLLDSVEFSPVPVLFMLDEFAQLGRMAIIENNIAQMRGYGIKLWTVWQDIQQIKDTYKDGWHKFVSTAESKITFTSHHVETREYFSQLAGDRLYSHTTKSKSVSETSGTNTGNSTTQHPFGFIQQNIGVSGGTSSGRSVSESTNEQNLSERRIKPYEIAALDADEALIFARRGFVHKSICPQPEMLPEVRTYIGAARAIIDGK